MKKNCWEAMQCGREPGGENVAALGVCPARTEARLDGIHGGWNGGRACWVIAGTLCGGVVQGTFALKFGACEQCDFYRSVQEEEKSNFQFFPGASTTAGKR